MPDPTSPPSRWRTVPRSSVTIFLLAVFCVFASFGFVSDATDLGRQAPLRFAAFVFFSGVFAVCYAYAGIRLRGKFWYAFFPLIFVQMLWMTLLANLLPEPPRPVQFSIAETARLGDRLSFDGVAIIIAVCLGYAGFVIVSVREGRRHGLDQLKQANLEAEMAAAREVQRVMVPEELPPMRDYSIESVYRPANEVGGDFFQVIPLKSGRTLVVLGDVSGKGLRAAMIVSMIVGSLRTVCAYTEEPAEILGELNRRLYGRVHEGFATCVAIRFDEHGALTLANAGHLPPYLDGIEIATPGSLPLGLDENAVYEQSAVKMQPGQSAVLLTDGIAEAQDGNRQLFGFTRIESTLRAGATAKELAEEAEVFGQDDDITVLSVTRRR